MNTMRVFLHDLLWQQDADGIPKRIDEFLKDPVSMGLSQYWCCSIPVGIRRRSWESSTRPRPGVHNSGWVQSPGAAALEDPKQYPRLEAYVKGVVGAFANDPTNSRLGHLERAGQREHRQLWQAGASE